MAISETSDFHKICRVCTPFQDALAGKIFFGWIIGSLEQNNQV